jgi:hypothetical protein
MDQIVFSLGGELAVVKKYGFESTIDPLRSESRLRDEKS